MRIMMRRVVVNVNIMYQCRPLDYHRGVRVHERQNLYRIQVLQDHKNNIDITGAEMWEMHQIQHQFQQIRQVVDIQLCRRLVR